MNLHGPLNIPPTPPRQLVATLRQAIARLETKGRPASAVVSSGQPALDHLLPQQGFLRGTLVEWLPVGEGCGAESLAIHTAARAARDDGAVVVFDARQQFYPPAAARAGIVLERLIVVRAATAADEAWALDQALRCAGVAAALAWPARLDGKTFRRLQLAAEEGGTLGLLVRSAEAAHEPSWADVRLRVEPLPAARGRGSRRLRIELLRCRGTVDGATVDLEVDDETHALPVVSAVEATTRPHRARRA